MHGPPHKLESPVESSGPGATPSAPGVGDATVPDRAPHVLPETAGHLGRSLEPEAIFTRLLDSVGGAMPCDGLIVSSFDRTQNLIRCAYPWVGGNLLDPASLPPLEYRADSEGMQSQVIRTGRPMLFSDVADSVGDANGKNDAGAAG